MERRSRFSFEWTIRGRRHMRLVIGHRGHVAIVVVGVRSV